MIIATIIGIILNSICLGVGIARLINTEYKILNIIASTINMFFIIALSIILVKAIGE